MSSLFENAPVTLGVFITTVLFSFLFGGTGLVQFDPNRIMHGGEIWRFLFGHLAFRSMAQTVVGLILLYFYRSFERQMGSRKYGGFLFLSWMYSSIIYAILLLITNSASFNFSPSSGPFFFIFAQLAFFYRYVPKIFQNQYVLLGISFSEKSGIYLLAAQLFFSDGWESMVASLIALSFGFLYSQNIVRIQQFRLPSVVEVRFLK
jgi:membrane associated rhomboid family serine protease